MKKRVICAFLMLYIVFGCCGCAPTTYWKWSQDKQNIKKVCIVEYEDFENYTIIKELELEVIEELCLEISGLLLTKFLGGGGEPKGKAFLFEYQNGEQDIIAQNPGMGYCDKKGKLYWNNSLHCFDVEEFNNLINKYLNE